IRIDYGRADLEIEVPSGVQAEVAESPRAVPLAKPADAIATAIANPIGTAAFADLARGKRDAVVVISDKTRPVPNGILLPPILELLEHAGIARERIEMLVGTGLHRGNTRDELVEMTSEAIVAGYRIRNHAAREAAEHRHLGRTRRGTEIWLDRGYL